MEIISIIAITIYPDIYHIGSFQILRHFLHSPCSVYSDTATQDPPTTRRIMKNSPKLLNISLTDRMASTHINSMSAAIASFNLSVYFITLDYLFSPFNGFYPFSFPLKHRFHIFIVSVCSSDHFSDKRASLISDYLL